MYRTRPYEVEKGATDKAVAECKEILGAALRENRSVLWALVQARPVRASHGQVVMSIAIMHDITAQKQLEGQLQASQFYTRSLIESNIDALMTTDSLGIITDVNEQMAALTGCTREELIGTPFKNHFTDPARTEEGIRLVLEKSKVTNYELTARSKKGKETVVSYNATTFYDQSGKLQGVFAAARDITEQKKLQEQLVQLATYDSLTGLANRALFLRETSRAAARCQKLCSLVCKTKFQGSIKGASLRGSAVRRIAHHRLRRNAIRAFCS